MALTEGIKRLKTLTNTLAKPLTVLPFLLGRGVRGVGPDSVNTMSVVVK